MQRLPAEYGKIGRRSETFAQHLPMAKVIFRRTTEAQSRMLVAWPQQFVVVVVVVVVVYNSSICKIADVTIFKRIVQRNNDQNETLEHNDDTDLNCQHDADTLVHIVHWSNIEHG
ncbi:hypothetical protein T4D_5781 [Trichinella pseudospiralis]|uniref:Uncharacterized protein n=1 Tax=Trichinella pseudospiralis TaxID=6337 RepID=A0A0V1FQ23_TRIPS|nr:hypothetical protein T4D_5781 [Trichinella pseudospiralis]